MNVAAGKVKLLHIVFKRFAAELYLNNVLLCIVAVYDAVWKLRFQFLELRRAYIHLPDGEHGQTVDIIKRRKVLYLIAVKVQRSERAELFERCNIAYFVVRKVERGKLFERREEIKLVDLIVGKLEARKLGELCYILERGRACALFRQIQRRRFHVELLAADDDYLAAVVILLGFFEPLNLGFYFVAAAC